MTGPADTAAANLRGWHDAHVLIENHDDDDLIQHTGTLAENCPGCAWQRAMVQVFADLLAVLDEREQLAARVAELQRERDVWKSEAERRSAERNASARRVGALRAWLYELGYAPDAVDQRLRRVVAELVALDEQLETEREAETASVPIPVLRQAWRNGWTDRANAMRQTIADTNEQRNAYERAFARYMSEDPAEDDKDPYRPLDGPGDPAIDTDTNTTATTTPTGA